MTNRLDYMRRYMRIYRHKNREKLKEYMRAWRLKNPEKARAIDERRATKQRKPALMHAVT